MIAALAISLSLAPAAPARDVDWVAELAFDAALAGIAVGFAVVGPDEARYGRDAFPTQGLDDRVHRSVHGAPGSEAVSARERAFRYLSDASVITASSLPAGLAIAGDGAARPGRLLTTAHVLLFTNAATTTLKHAFRRPRPEPRFHEAVPDEGDDALSFPSGHTSMAFAGATTVARLFPEAPFALKAGAFGLATVTAFARIAGDKHFLTDVAAGAALGSGVALAGTAWHGGGSVELVAAPAAVGFRLRL